MTVFPFQTLRSAMAESKAVLNNTGKRYTCIYLCLIKQHTTHTYRGAVVELHAFLTRHKIELNGHFSL